MSSTDASDESSVRIICGPTGAGKSALAMQLAESFGALIVSADSRQIYRGFDIGTAKPPVEDRLRVPHRGVDVAEPSERYSAAQWAQEARGWMEEARRLGRAPVIVGGTGFYLRALVEPLFEAPVLDNERRKELERVFAGMTTEELRRWCSSLDPGRSPLGRTQLIRSVETALLTGERLSDLHRTRARAPEICPRYLVVDPGASLGMRLERRFDTMIADGWREEVEQLSATVDESAPAWKASGYAAVRDMIAGRLSEREAKERVIIETRQYAKRQRTWFRHQLDESLTTRVDPNEPDRDKLVRQWWVGSGTGRNA